MPTPGSAGAEWIISLLSVLLSRFVPNTTLYDPEFAPLILLPIKVLWEDLTKELDNVLPILIFSVNSREWDISMVTAVSSVAVIPPVISKFWHFIVFDAIMSLVTSV